MNIPICLSKYFVNKQNVRSYSNILKSDYFIDDSGFYKHILQYDFVSEKDIFTDLLSVLLLIKNNLKNNLNKDFKKCFDTIENFDLHSLNKEAISQCCWIGISDIIPKKFFGNYKNIKLFQQLVKKTVFSMKYQHFKMSYYIDKWDVGVYPWKTLPVHSVKLILFNVLFWILRYILSPMIALNFYVTTCKLDSNENELHFFWKHRWQSYYDKKISSLILLKIIQKIEPFSFGKKVKRFRNPNDNMKLRIMNKNIPRLHLVLKPNNEYRPLVKYRNEQKKLKDKYRIKEKLYFLKTLTNKCRDKIETGFIKVHQQWLKMNKPKLYFVKADLSNAFGSIDKEKLLNILRERYAKYQKTELCGHKKKLIARQYKDMVAELQKPLLIRSGSTIFEWKKGLVQGYKYSPALSEIYYQYMDEIYFSEHFKVDGNIKYFTRIVDDYLYITNSLDDAQLFLKSLSNYKNVNYEKTLLNFEYPNIKYSQEITFLGYSYNTQTLEVSRTSNVYLGQMCYKIAFTSTIINLNKFIENRIGQSGIQVNSHLFNLKYNNEELIWKHIFTTFCLSANKFCTILAIVCEEIEMLNYLALYKSRVTVKLTNSMVETLLRNKPTDFVFLYCINHFRYLSWMAFNLCAQNTPKCHHLIPHIKNELAKSNCMFGKWREHARIINGSGECVQRATQVICRRTDLRCFIKKFHTLPDGFEFYNLKFK